MGSGVASPRVLTIDDLPPDLVEMDAAPEQRNGDSEYEVPRGIQAERAERDRREEDHDAGRTRHQASGDAER